MVTKAIITDISNNTCTVRIPLFDTVKSISDGVPGTTFATPPGFSNSYQVGDIVFIYFEDNEVNKPIVIGKLYLTNQTKCVGGIYCEDLQVSNSASLPINTKIVQSPGFRTEASALGQFSFNSLGDIIKSIAFAANTASTTANNTTNLQESITAIEESLGAIEQNIFSLQLANKYWIEQGDLSPLPSTKLVPIDPLAPDGPKMVVWDTEDINFVTNYKLYGGALPLDPALQLEEELEEGNP